MEYIKLNSSLGEFFIFENGGNTLTQSNFATNNTKSKFHENLKQVAKRTNQFIYKNAEENTIGIVVKRNDRISSSCQSIRDIKGIKLVFEKPAKGGGIVSVAIERENSISSFFYGHIKVFKHKTGGWDYEQWNQQKAIFEQDVIDKIIKWTNTKVTSRKEFSNC